ncbi:MAG: biopolymer transporter ExbD [Deltaproteobacteria bacterium]|nr:biopolymer transporter ExbD [Deltaproteobacteria bacterium]
MQFKVKNQETPSIEIAPLIDVVFLLLLFFMVTTEFSARPGLMIRLPEIQTGKPVTTAMKVDVSITMAGDIYVDGEPVAEKDLKTTLKKAARNPESTVVVLSADKSIPHGRVVSMMDVMRGLGLKRIVIAARWEKDPKAKE